MLDNFKTIQKDRMAEILNTILGAKQITRGELGSLLKLSPSSIVKYLKILIDLGIVRESGLDVATGGRRSSYIEFAPRAGVNIAVVFNQSSLKGALVNPAGVILESITVNIHQHIPAKRLLEKLDSLLESLIQKAGTADKRIFGIGIGMGDYLDMEKGISRLYHQARNWYDVDLKSRIESRFGLPFFLINDIDAGALGEKYYGAGMGVENFVCLWIDETVGMGMVLNGEIYLRKTGFVGEIGHTRAVKEGPLCVCGNTGCLETVTGESCILSRCREGISAGVRTEVLGLCGGKPEKITMEQMIAASNSGDRFCRNLFAEISEYLGEKLTDMANILNPELIILRGSVVQGNSFLYGLLKQYVINNTLRPISDQIRIECPDSPEDIRLQGISSHILSKYFLR